MNGRGVSPVTHGDAAQRKACASLKALAAVAGCAVTLGITDGEMRASRRGRDALRDAPERSVDVKPEGRFCMPTPWRHAQQSCRSVVRQTGHALEARGFREER